MHDVVDTAVSAGAFKTLVAAGLVDTLKGTGPFTVFAPTDDASGKLLETAVEQLLKAENRPKLQGVLTYHVVSGQVLSAHVLNLKSVQSVQGQNLTIDTAAGLKVDGGNVIQTDILCTNAVIHILDSVMLPQ